MSHLVYDTSYRSKVAIKVDEPLVVALPMVHGNKLAVGYIYEAMDN